jgi:hypothetical protein
MLAEFCFYIFISSEHVIIYTNVVPACLQNTSGLTMCLLCIFAKFAFGLPPARCKFHSVDHQPDANFIQLAASRIQISFSRLPAGCKLHPATGLAIQNTQIYQCGMWPATKQRLAASRMQILQK